MEQLKNLLARISSGSASQQMKPTSESEALKAAAAIFGSFRKTDADDPSTMVTAYVRILQVYPPEVVQAIADPLTGIAREQTFLPSIAELTASLERRMGPIRAAEEKRRRFAETAEFLRQSANPTHEQRESAAERWESTKAEITGKTRRSQAEIRQEAEKHLVELYHARDEPFTLSAAARRKAAG
jgi:predicted Zn-dependent protease